MGVTGNNYWFGEPYDQLQRSMPRYAPQVTFALIYWMVGEGHKSAKKQCRETPFGRLVENHRDQLLSEDEGLTPKTKKVRELRVQRNQGEP